MNPLAAINKNLRELETSYAKIKTPETREKARLSVESAMNRMGWMSIRGEDLGVTGASTASQSSVATVTLGEAQDRCGAVVGLPVGLPAGTVMTSTHNGVTTVYPADYKPFVDEGERGPGVCEDEERAIEGDLPGTSGTFYAETVSSVPEPQWIGGWPEYAFIEVIGLFPNRRSLKGTIGDGRTVHVERRMDWKPGRIKGRLVRAGASALYRTMA